MMHLEFTTCCYKVYSCKKNYQDNLSHVQIYKNIFTNYKRQIFSNTQKIKMTINHIHNQINASMEIKIIEVEYYIGGRKKLSKMIRIENKIYFTTYNDLELEKH